MFANGFKIAGVLTAAATVVGLAAPATQAQISGSILIDGSSTVFPITEAMAEDFSIANPGVEVSVGVSGTGGGFSKFCAGETVINNASRAIKGSETEACAANGIEFTEIQVGIDAITVVVSSDTQIFGSPGTVEGLSIDQLNAIWDPSAERRIRRWSQVDRSWANRLMVLFGPGTDSGTFDFFTDEVNGEEGASRADYTASEDDNILVLGVSRSPYALGYFGLAYYLENQDTLKALPIEGIAPSFETAASGDYPLSRPLFMYVNNDALERPEVAAFVEFYLETARDTDLVREVGYVAMEEDLYTTILADLGL
ncbi:MAG: PstS family phosphate ABC transporter substrate-binding protein [Cyanobacteria bacterium]|nr:PstS family phosphate ABC transporter substrate-binding protein [Cyanobacteriota bacterium]